MNDISRSWNLGCHIPTPFHSNSRLVICKKRNWLQHCFHYRYDHLKNEVSEVSDDDESEKEEWRAAVDSSFESYIAKHYPDGIYSVMRCSIFTLIVLSVSDGYKILRTFQVYCKIKNDNIVVTVCIEDHKFQPKNFWNGRYRSEWCATIDSNERNAQIVGILRNQVGCLKP